MQRIKLLKVPGDRKDPWKDPLYTSRNVYKSAFHECSSSGISRSLMGVLNICFHPPTLASCHSTCTWCLWGCGAASQPALEDQKGKGNYHQQGRADWGVPSPELVGFVPKDTQNCGLQKPKAVPKDTMGRCPRCAIATTTTLCSISSVGTVVPPPEAIAMRTHHHHHHGKNPCDMTLDFFCYLLPNMRQLKQFALSPFKLTSSSCQMALSLFCKRQHTDGTEGLCSGSTTVPLH